MKHLVNLIAVLCLVSLQSPNRSVASSATALEPHSVLIGNYLVTVPNGIAFVVDGKSAFVLDPGGEYYAGEAAPDDSYHHARFHIKGASVDFTWGRIGTCAIGRLTANQPLSLALRLSSGWPGFSSTFSPTVDGVSGSSMDGRKQLTWRLRTSPSPETDDGDSLVLRIGPLAPAYLSAGFGVLPPVQTITKTLAVAKARYERRRPSASGDHGDFLGAIEANLNNSRVFSSDTNRVAHTVSRGWAGGKANNAPLFCWDSFFNGNLASLDDPTGARRTVRAILQWQTAAGMVPNFGHWGTAGQRASDDRSQPPVGALCVWKMEQRWPDLKFLRWVYPKLKRWHAWWMRARDGNHDGLLEWGSSSAGAQGARWETGWDDTPQFDGARMSGETLDADAVDLNALYTMDAEYLARLANELGYTRDASRYRAERSAMIRRINRRLWNPAVGTYCSRLWHAERQVPVPQSAFGTGFDVVFYNRENLESPVARIKSPAIQFDWNGKPPLAGVPADHWSARFTGTFTPPKPGRYLFKTSADDGVRLLVAGHKVIDDWSVHGLDDQETVATFDSASPQPVSLEYFQAAGGSALTMTVAELEPAPAAAEFLTRLTPMNFYPLIAGIPDASRTRQMLALLTDPHRFWGTWIVPTLSYRDPLWPQQRYWHGTIWGPVNYLLFQGLMRDAPARIQNQIVARSLHLFLRNWDRKRVCGENFLSTDGDPGGDLHYTWGALLCLMGVENLCDFGPNGTVRLNGLQTETVELRNLPIHGLLYTVRARPHVTKLLRNGRVVATARKRVVWVKLPSALSNSH
ncbi:MAG: hypothetical protein KGJ62_11430 [Armatimonadetes bacterium]|nr:hypothetical protein [Armatimonadota bacterium]MDE2206472.1 hypothetical protein [Armatimonadota bacterium]